MFLCYLLQGQDFMKPILKETLSLHCLIVASIED